MATFAVPLAFSAGVAPVAVPAWRFQVGLEASYLPNVDAATATPTTCRPDKPGPENTDLMFAAVRPRAWLSLPSGFELEASWIPPIRLGEARANLWGFAITRTTPLTRRLAVAVRGHATVGRVEGPITCDDAALQDLASPCYQGTRSNDSFRPNVFGASASVSWSVGRAGTGGYGLHPFLGVGYNHLAPRFQVDFTNRFGNRDRRKVTVDLDRVALFAGASWTAHRLLTVSGEIYSAPVDAITGRLVAQLRLR